MSEVTVGGRRLHLSEKNRQRLTLDEASRARQFAESLEGELGVLIDRLNAALNDEELHDRNGGTRGLQRTLESIAAKFGYVNAGVRNITALNYLTIRQDDDE